MTVQTVAVDPAVWEAGHAFIEAAREYRRLHAAHQKLLESHLRDVSRDTSVRPPAAFKTLLDAAAACEAARGKMFDLLDAIDPPF